MTNKIFGALLFVFLFGSCKSSIKFVADVNANRKFTSSDEYFNSNFGNTTIEREKMIFLTDDDFNKLLTEIVDNNLSSYYGIAYKKFISADQLNIKSCRGQIINLYNLIDDHQIVLQEQNLSDVFVLRELQLNTEKKTVIFLYSYKLGKLSKNQINSVITNLMSDLKFDYRIISLDNFDIH